MESNLNRRIETDLDLNGPYLAISSHPSDATVNHGATQTFSITASATFPGNDGAADAGTLTYQWYEDDEGEINKLANETIGSLTYSGTTTATLTLTNISSPSENGHKYYCVIDYTAADKYDESGKGTGNPITGTVTSNSATLTVNPYIIILSQPLSIDREFDQTGSLSVSAVLSDSSYTNDIGYQWYYNGNSINDGTITSYRIERGTVTTVVREDKEVVTRHNYSYNNTFNGSADTRSIPSTATNIDVEIAAGSGGRGGNDAQGSGGSGGDAIRGKFRLPSHLTAGTTLTMYAGLKGGDGVSGAAGAGSEGGGGRHGGWAGGGNGGTAGQNGSSGGGAGGGGASGVYHGDGTLMIVAGGGGGGGGASNPGLDGVDPGTPVDINYSYGYPRQQFGVHSWNGQPGKIIKYGDGGGSDANGELYITSGNATFSSYTKIVGSGPVRLQYNWSDMPNYSGRANDKIYIGGLATLEHPATRRGSNAATFTMPGNAGAKNAGSWDNKSSTMWSDGGHQGHPAQPEGRDGGGGGGGGAGYVSSPGSGAGSGGAKGHDNAEGGTSGNGGPSAYRGDYASLYVGNVGYHNGNGYVTLSYDWYEDETTTETTWTEVETEVEEQVPQHLTFTNTQSSSITAKADYAQVANLYCVVSSPTATNSPVTTNTVQFSTFSNLDTRTLNIEQVFWKDGTGTCITSQQNLRNAPITLGYDDGTNSSGLNIFTSFWVPTDTPVTIDLYGGKGEQWTPAVADNAGQNASSPVGLGGYGRIQGTLLANTEYVVAGMFGSVDAPYFYRRDQILAVVGQGGGNNVYGSGGFGGGLDLPGRAGMGGHGAGNGSGESGAITDPRTWGTFGSRYPLVGGRTGQILNQRLYDACQRNGDGWYYDDQRDGGEMKRYSRDINNDVNLGTRQIIMRDGSFLSNSASIDRGFMDIEYSFIQTAGGRGVPQGAPNDDPTNNNGSNATCVGGHGAWGGNGGYNGSGGGGGGGYLDDSIQTGGLDGTQRGRFILEETTSGTWDGNSKIVISLQ
tara:strand:- start:194 stop:3250 length:3057 start_codon:yes stop_codon:yes gene_type:complete